MIRPRTPTRIRRSHPLRERAGLFNRPCLECGKATTSTRCPGCTQKRQTSSLRVTGSTWQWRKDRRAKLTRDPLCQEWSCSQAATQVDHIRPRALGGADEPSNLTSYCDKHAKAKTRGERLHLRPSASTSWVTFA